MNSRTYLITSHAPLVFGDGRPFTNEAGSQKVRSLAVPHPSTLAGALRSSAHLTKSAGANPEWKKNKDTLLAQESRGPLLAAGCDQVLCLPTPSSLQLLSQGGSKVDKECHARQPREPQGWGCLLPDGLLPLSLSPECEDRLELPETDSDSLRPTKDKLRPWVTLPSLMPWLTGSLALDLPEDVNPPDSESRLHVSLEASTLTAAQGMLYQTDGVWFGKGMASPDGEDQSLWIVAELSSAAPPEALALTLGGERRIATAAPAPEDLLQVPSELGQALSGAEAVTMLLATPGSFTDGWKPGWLDSSLQGTPPGAPSSLRLRLKGASIQARSHVSGWDLDSGRPKPVRWLAPSGSVYYFEVVSGDPSDLSALWLRSVADTTQDRRDGWSLACWGVWAP